jgi:MFS family permease
MNQKRKGKIFGIERNVFYSGMTSFLTDTSGKMVYSVMPLFLLSIGASKTTISLIEGIAESTSSLLKAVSGIWSDRIGKNKPFMIFGYGLTALVTPFYSLIWLPIQVLVLRFIERIGKGVRTAPRDSLISGSVLDNKAGRNFGFHKAMDNSGAILGPLFAWLLLLVYPRNYKFVFLLSAIPAILGVINLWIFVKEAKRNQISVESKPTIKKLPSKFWLFLGVITIFSLGNSTDALMLVKATETGISTSNIPFMYMIFNVVSVFLAIPIGNLSDRVGRGKLILAGYLVYSLTYFLFGRLDSILSCIFLFALYGLYSALADGSQKALVSDIAGKQLKGTGFGIYHAVLGITLLPASLIAGVLYDKVNSDAPFYFGSVLSLCAAVLMLFFNIWIHPAKQKNVAIMK